jgi:hypothetical protein
MSGVILEYTVEDKDTYAVEKGDVGRIHEKSSNGFVLNEFIEDFTIVLKLRSPGVILLIEMCPFNAKSITFELLDKEGNPHEDNTRIFSHSEATLIDFPASRVNRTLTWRVKLHVLMDSRENGGTGIKYLLVKGEKNDTRSLK